MTGVNDNSEEDWRSNLSNWRNRRKSHSSTQKLDEIPDEEMNHVDREDLEQQPKRRPKTFKEMLAEKEKRLGNFASYSYDDDIIPKTLGRKESTSDGDTDDHHGNNPASNSEINQNNNSNGSRDSETVNHQPTLRNSSTPLRQRTRERPDQMNNGKLTSDLQDSPIRRPANHKKHSEKIIKISQRPNNEKGFGFTVVSSSSGGSGILIERVTRGSSADVNELKSNDEILSIDDIDVTGKSMSAVLELLSSAAKVGQIKLKIRRLLENGAEEDVFEEDEFIMSQERRHNPRQSLVESELSTPPPSPPRLSMSDYSDEPPPLPNLPPPPPNWNTFPGAEPSPTVSVNSGIRNVPQPINSKKPSVAPNNPYSVAPNAAHPSDDRNDNKQGGETSKEEILRKRFEFLGLPVENSEEYKRILEEKEETKTVQVPDATSAALAEDKAAVSAYIASITEKKREELPSSTYKSSTNKSKPFDPYEVYKSSNEFQTNPEVKSDLSADRARFKREAEERHIKEQEELAKRSAVRRSSHLPSEPVESEPLRETKEDSQKDEDDTQTLQAINRQKVESLREEILKESRVSPRDTFVGNVMSSENDIKEKSPVQPVKMNMRGTESLPYRGVEETFPNLQEAPWSKKTQAAASAADGERQTAPVVRRDGVGGSLNLSSENREIRGSPVGSDKKMDENSSKYQTKPSTMFAPQPYIRPNHSRSASSEILKSGSDFHERQLSAASDVPPGSERPCKKLARSFDNSAKIIIGKHSAPAPTKIDNRISPREERKQKTLTEDMSKVKLAQNKFEENTINLPLSPGIPSPRQSELVTEGGAQFPGPVTIPQAYNNTSREKNRQDFKNDFEAIRRPKYSAGEPQYVQNAVQRSAGPIYSRSTSTEPIRQQINSYSHNQNSSPVRDYTKVRTSSVGELSTEGSSNIAFLLYGENNGAALSSTSGPKDPKDSRWIEPSRKSLIDTFSSTAQLIDNYKRIAPASGLNPGKPGTNVSNPSNVSSFRVPGADANFNEPPRASNGNRASLSSYNNGNTTSEKIPLSTKITVDTDYNIINPYERFTYVPVVNNVRAPSSSEYNSIPASDRFVKDLVQSYTIPSNQQNQTTRRPSESSALNNQYNANRYEQPSYSAGYNKTSADYLNSNVDYKKSQPQNRNSVITDNSHYRNPDSYVQSNNDEFIPLQSRLVSDRPPRNGEPWSPSSLSPQRRDFPVSNSAGSAHWLIEEAERRRIAESSGKPRHVTMHRTITTEENPSIRIGAGVNSRASTLNRQPSASVQNIYAAQSNFPSDFKPNNYDQRRQTLNPQLKNESAPITFPSSPTFQWYSGKANNKQINPSNSMMVVPGANDRARITAQPSASYVASGAVDSLFSYMGSGSARDVPNNSSNLSNQRPLSYSQGNLYPGGAQLTSPRSNQSYGYDYDNTGYNAAGLKYSQL